jgi:hypothetical protein
LHGFPSSVPVLSPVISYSPHSIPSRTDVPTLHVTTAPPSQDSAACIRTKLVIVLPSDGLYDSQVAKGIVSAFSMSTGLPSSSVTVGTYCDSVCTESAEGSRHLSGEESYPRFPDVARSVFWQQEVIYSEKEFSVALVGRLSGKKLLKLVTTCAVPDM